MDNEQLLDKLWSIAGEIKAITENLEANTISKERATHKLAKLQEDVLRTCYRLNISVQAYQKTNSGRGSN